MDCREYRARISKILEGDLDAPEMEAALTHQATCRECTREMQRFRGLVRLVDELPDPVPDETVRFDILDRIMAGTESFDAPEIMDVKQLSRYLGITAEDLAEEIENLPAFSFAGKLRFKKEHIDHWIEERVRERTRGIEAARAANWLKRRDAG